MYGKTAHDLGIVRTRPHHRSSRVDIGFTPHGDRYAIKHADRYRDGADTIMARHRAADAVATVTGMDTPETWFDDDEDEIYMEHLGTNLLEASPGQLEPVDVDADIDSFYDAVATKLVLQDYDAWSNIYLDADGTARAFDFDYVTAYDQDRVWWHVSTRANTMADALDHDFDPERAIDRADTYRERLIAQEDEAEAKPPAARAIIGELVHETKPYADIIDAV